MNDSQFIQLWGNNHYHYIDIDIGEMAEWFKA